MRTANRFTAALALAAAITLFGAVPAQAAQTTAVPERLNATASTEGGVLPQAGWRFESYHSTWIACASKGTALVAIGQAEDWTCVQGSSWQLHLYAWWF